jgi:hypothetical protein
MEPQDLRVDLNNPFAGIVKGNGNFAASFVDVSIHFFDRSMSPERLRAYFTRNGGERVQTPE